MERWQGAVAIVTGDNVQPAIIKMLLDHNIKVVVLGRNLRRINVTSTNLHLVKCNTTKDAEVGKSVAAILEKHGAIKVLINFIVWNAADVATLGDSSKMRRCFESNLLPLGICNREIVDLMRKNRADCHLINILSGKVHDSCFSSVRKGLVDLSECLRRELNQCQHNSIKVTDLTYQSSSIEPADVAHALVYVLSSGKRVEVKELTLGTFNN